MKSESDNVRRGRGGRFIRTVPLFLDLRLLVTITLVLLPLIPTMAMAAPRIIVAAAGISVATVIRVAVRHLVVQRANKILISERGVYIWMQTFENESEAKDDESNSSIFFLFGADKEKALVVSYPCLRMPCQPCRASSTSPSEVRSKQSKSTP